MTETEIATIFSQVSSALNIISRYSKAIQNQEPKPNQTIEFTRSEAKIRVRFNKIPSSAFSATIKGAESHQNQRNSQKLKIKKEKKKFPKQTNFKAVSQSSSLISQFQTNTRAF